MIEIQANILSNEILSIADAVCFTSNGMLTYKGELVMGAGIALSFKQKWPGIQRAAGIQVAKTGNHCYLLAKHDGVNIISFPTKNHWKYPSDLKLIIRSAQELMSLIKEHNWSRVYITRMGCGLGRLNWNEVKNAVRDILDNRVIVCYK